MSNLPSSFNLLELNIISAQDLAPVSRSMRTYAVAWVHPDRKLSTRVNTQGHNSPSWNEKFVFRVDEEFLQDETSTITIEVYALHWCKDIHVGTVCGRISQLLAPQSINAFNNNRTSTKMNSVALQVRRPSGRPQGIINLGATILDSSMKSIPLYPNESGAQEDYDDSVMEDREETRYERDHDNRHHQTHRQFQNKELRRVQSDTSSMVIPEFVQQKATICQRRNSLSPSELSLNQHQNGNSIVNSMLRSRMEGVNRVAEEEYAHEYFSDVINSDEDDDGVPTTKVEEEETEHRDMTMESQVIDPPIYRKKDRDSAIDSSEEENEMVAEENKQNHYERIPGLGIVSGSSRRGTPVHPLVSASPQHRLSATPRHTKMATPQHPMYGTPRHRLAGVTQHVVSSSPRHRMVGLFTPQHPMSHTPRLERAQMFGTPQHERAGIFTTPKQAMGKNPRFATPRHQKVSSTPRHEMMGSTRYGMAGTPRHVMAATPLHHRLASRTPMHPLSGTPLHKRSGSNQMGKPGTPLHGMSLTKFIEFEALKKSNVMGPATTITDSELGPSPSEVAAAVAKAPRPIEHENSAIDGWTADDSSVEGLEAKLDRWKTELPPVYDNGDIPSSGTNSISSRSVGKRNGRKKSSGLFSCFSNICGLQCTIVCGGSKGKKEKKEKPVADASSEVTSYL